MIFRQGVRGLLEREGFQVVGEAGDGHEAVRLTQAAGPDVAVLDLGMPLLSMPPARFPRSPRGHGRSC